MIIAWSVLFIEGLICYFFNIPSLGEGNGFETISAIIVIINAVAVMINISRINTSDKVKIVLVAAFLLRLAFFFWDWNMRKVFVLPGSGADSEMYAKTAKYGFFYGDYGKGELYSQCIGMLVYRFFGVQRFVAQYVNVLLGMETILITKKILNKIGINNNVEYRLLLLISLIPNFAILNAILLRESVMIFLIAISLQVFLKWFNGGSKIALLISIMLPIFGTQFHSGAIAPAVAYIGCAMLYKRNTNTFNISAKTIVLLIIVLFGIIALSSMSGAKLFGSKFEKIDSMEDVARGAELANDGGSAYDVGVHTGNQLVDMVVNTPIRMFYFVLSPMPWMWRGLNDIIAFFFSALVYGYAYMAAYKELRRKDTINRNIIIICIFIAVASALIFAWGVSNAGTALRHRDKFICPYMVLIGLCWNEKYMRFKV